MSVLPNFVVFPLLFSSGDDDFSLSKNYPAKNLLCFVKYCAQKVLEKIPSKALNEELSVEKVHCPLRHGFDDTVCYRPSQSQSFNERKNI
jgi:hypothetical protein